MPTLTSSVTLSIGDGAIVSEAITLTVFPALSGITGRGRLIHPTLGTYDYAHQPDKWKGIDGDLLISPIWSYSKTLLGGANTLMAGHIRDSLCVEKWSFSMSLTQLRSLLLFWQNPPDPDDGYVQWWPNYTSENGFYVALVDLQVGDESITLDWIAQRHGIITSGVKLSLRVIGRVT